MKVIGSLDPIIQETIPSVILIEAIKIGYKVTKIYRADRYKSAESKFRNGLLGDMYVAKMKNAGKVPDEDQARMKNTFMAKYKIDLGDMNQYSKNPVLKKIAKGPVTAAWGKHAESVDHTKNIMFSKTTTEGLYFCDEILLNKSTLKTVKSIGKSILFNFTENRTMKRPELHKTYLPAAVFVTAYGRIKLWKQLVKIDPRGTPRKDLRVIMYDTDSIVYQCFETECSPSTHIEEGDCLGDWETEDIEKEHGGIIQFRAIAPKSYAIVCGDGHQNMKLKGAVLKYAHKKLMSPDIMRQLVESKRPGNTPEIIELPQMSFDYCLGVGPEAMTSRYFRKKIQFSESHVKGTFSWDDYRGYPTGFI